jgi:hypothetical protein
MVETINVIEFSGLVPEVCKATAAGFRGSRSCGILAVLCYYTGLLPTVSSLLLIIWPNIMDEPAYFPLLACCHPFSSDNLTSRQE